jgi:GNAT superfamily N-acetyltransferase
VDQKGKAVLVELARLDAEQAQQYMPELLDLYADAYDGPPWAGNPFYSVDRYAERLQETFGMKGFEIVNAVLDGDLVGTCYGVTLPPTVSWWTGLDASLPTELAKAAIEGRVFWLRQMLVRKAYRRLGAGRAMHDLLCSGRTEDFVTLSVIISNEPARSAYLSWGYEVIGEMRLAPESPMYEAMARPIRWVRSPS